MIEPGQESTKNAPWSRFARHHHTYPYAALVIRGSCHEAGDRGRFRAETGDVLFHTSFDAHGDDIGSRGAAFINFPLEAALPGWFGRLEDPDAVIRAHERDPAEAIECLHEQFRPVDSAYRDWPDLLARDIAAKPGLIFHQWADAHGLNPASVSRGFRQAYGVSPKRFRLERNASTAARRLLETRDTLSDIAAACGFADQAHMTRAICAIFGMTPRRLRAAG